MSEDEIISAIAKSKALANRLAKKSTVSQLERAIAHLSDALTTAKAREEARADKRREANIKKLTAMMADMGLSPDDIAALADKPARGRKAKVKTKKKDGRSAAKGSKVPPKYQIDVDGELVKWTGRGRMPVVFREYLDNGGSLEDLLIGA